MNSVLPVLTAFREIAVIAVAGFGVFVAWRRLLPAATQADAAKTQAQLARRSHVAELFNRAVGQLRDPNIEVRLAAIYVLREIARDFPDLSNPIFETLQAFIREGDMNYGDDEPPVDVRAIIDVLKERLGDT